MIQIMNPIYEAAWEGVDGTGSYYYSDPDKVEASGKELRFPVLFRLLRTSDTVDNTMQGRTFLVRNETFLACIRVEDYPDMDEEGLETYLMGLVQRFLKKLDADKRVQFSYPAQFNWYRRTLQQFALCVGFAMQVRLIKEELTC